MPACLHDQIATSAVTSYHHHLATMAQAENKTLAGT
jgi:hypothetical protein